MTDSQSNQKNYIKNWLTRSLKNSNLVFKLIAPIALLLISLNIFFSLSKLDYGLEYRGWNHINYDEFSDNDVYHGGLSYLDGRSSLLFPDIGAANGRSGERFVYKGYPSLPFMISGAMSSFGLDIYDQRRIFAIFTLISISIFFLILKRKINIGILTILCASGLFLTAPIYDNIGSIHQRPYFFVILCLLLGLQFSQKGTNQKHFLYFLVGFMTASISYEYLPIFFFIYLGLQSPSYLNWRSGSLSALLSFTIGGTLGVASHILRAIFSDGNYSLGTALVTRFDGTPASLITINYLDNYYSIIENFSISIGYSIYILLATALFFEQDRIKILWALLATISWAIVMPQHYFVHFHVVSYHSIAAAIVIYISAIQSKNIRYIIAITALGIASNIYYLNHTGGHNQSSLHLVSVDAQVEWRALGLASRAVDGKILANSFWVASNDCVDASAIATIELRSEIDMTNDFSQLRMYVVEPGSSGRAGVMGNVNVNATPVQFSFVRPYEIQSRRGSIVEYRYIIPPFNQNSITLQFFPTYDNQSNCHRFPKISEIALVKQ